VTEVIVVDIVIVCPENHATCRTGGLEEGGSITGLLEPTATVIQEINKLHDWSANVTLEKPNNCCTLSPNDNVYQKWDSAVAVPSDSCWLVALGFLCLKVAT
jgi:hypothetical protein